MNKDLLIDHNETINNALIKLNSLKDISRLMLFVLKEDTVIGSITDGDIRRSLINNQDLNQKVSLVCNTNFIYKMDTIDYIELKSFVSKGIKILPLLNEDKSLSRIIDLEKYKSIIPIECVIMAGGRGKRLSPLTDIMPKPMLKLASKPIIEYNIDNLISFGIKKFYISINYLGEIIKDYFGDGSSKGIEIEYIQEDKPLGTAGSLSLINNFKSDQILLMNSDLFTDVNIENMYLSLISHKADMIIASNNHSIDIPFGIFEGNNNIITSLKEKPTYLYHANAGIYIFNKKLIDMIPSNTYYDITDLMQAAIKSNLKLIHEPLLGYWIDIGSPQDYNRAKEIVKYIL